jgi:hypothetical protein
MKLVDIAKQFQRRLPLFSDRFTDNVSVASIVHAGTTATITTNENHGLRVNNAVHVFGAKTPIGISSITHAGDGIAIATTDSDHDLTLYSQFEEGNVVETSGATEADFNGSFTLLDVPNRRTFHFSVDTAAPAAATGSPILENGSNVCRVVKGLYAVATVTSSLVFTVEHTDASDLGTLIGTMSIRSNPRIAGVVDDVAAGESFTPRRYDDQTDGRPVEAWLYVILGDVTVSRGRDSRIDSIDIQSVGSDWQQYLNNPVQILVAMSAADQELGRLARDESSDFLRPILRSILGKKFDSGLASGEVGEMQFVGHGTSRYDGATYWHEYLFEARELIGFDDTVGAEDDVAFRDIEIQITPELDAGPPGAAHVPIEVDTSLDDTVL